ncbi:MAG: hypothetical protein ICV63_06530 [Coleofasciculus sp. Co-bin14]|nr:hypothetical protein [Coleofasciculus sp. Co-bin14]
MSEFKKIKYGILTRTISLLTSSLVLGLVSLASSALLETPAYSQSCRYYPNKSLYRNRTGNLVVGNSTDKTIRVTLYHPDTGTAQTTTVVLPGRQISIPNSGTFIADDWGIQINNGCAKYVGNITHYLVNNNGINTYQLIITDHSR